MQSSLWNALIPLLTRKVVALFDTRFPAFLFSASASDSHDDPASRKVCAEGFGREKRGAGRKLKNMRFTLLRRSQNVRGKARVRLQEVIKPKGATARAWLLKEGFQHFWTYRSVDWATGFLDNWITKALQSRLEPMKKVARMLRSHRGLIGNYFRAKKLYNGGVVEGLNLKCNLVKRRAYGLCTFPALQVSLYHNLRALLEPEFARRFF
jgi:transposase